MAKEERNNDIGRNGRRLINSTQLIQWLILGLIAGGFSIGGISFVNKDTADTISSLKVRSAVIEQQVRAIQNIDGVKEKRIDEKFQELRDDINELKKQLEEYQKEQRAVNKNLMNTLRKILDKQK